MNKIELLLEAESRGILPPDKAELLAEARARGLVPGGDKRFTAGSGREKGSFLEGVGEEALALGSGMVAGPVANVAGLAAMPLHFLNEMAGKEPLKDPLELRNQIRDALTYEPKTEANLSVQKMDPMRYIADWLARGGENAKKAYLASGEPPPEGSARDQIAQGVGRGIEEGVMQLPNLVAPALTKGAAKGAGRAVEAGGERLMQSALKPSEELRNSYKIVNGKRVSEADIVRERLFDEGANVSHGGIDKLSKRVTDVKSIVDDAIDAATADPANNLRVRPIANAVFNDVMKQIMDSDAAPTAAVTRLNELRTDFIRTHPAEMSIKEAHTLKQGLYKAIDDFYGSGKGGKEVGTDKKFDISTARGLKEGIESKIPGIKEQNAELGGLVEALQAIRQRVGAEGNTSALGIAPMAHGPAGIIAYLGQKYGVTASMAARLLNSMGEGLQGGFADVASVGSSIPASIENRPTSLRDLARKK